MTEKMSGLQKIEARAEAEKRWPSFSLKSLQLRSAFIDGVEYRDEIEPDA